MIRALASWYASWIWDASIAPPGRLRACLFIAEHAPLGRVATDLPDGVDLIVSAFDGDEAVAMIRRLGRLGTVAELDIHGVDRLPPGVERTLERVARKQRGNGMVCRFADH